jgi:hypothetical protein
MPVTRLTPSIHSESRGKFRAVLRRYAEFPRNNATLRALVKALENGPSDGNLWEIPVDFGPFGFCNLALDTLGVTGSSPVAPNHNLMVVGEFSRRIS